MKGRGFYSDISGDTFYQAVHAIFALRINEFLTVDFSALRLKSSDRAERIKIAFKILTGKKIKSRYLPMP